MSRRNQPYTSLTYPGRRDNGSHNRFQQQQQQQQHRAQQQQQRQAAASTGLGQLQQHHGSSTQNPSQQPSPAVPHPFQHPSQQPPAALSHYSQHPSQQPPPALAQYSVISQQFSVPIDAAGASHGNVLNPMQLAGAHLVAPAGYQISPHVGQFVGSSSYAHRFQQQTAASADFGQPQQSNTRHTSQQPVSSMPLQSVAAQTPHSNGFDQQWVAGAYRSTQATHHSPQVGQFGGTTPYEHQPHAPHASARDPAHALAQPEAGAAASILRHPKPSRARHSLQHGFDLCAVIDPEQHESAVFSEQDELTLRDVFEQEQLKQQEHQLAVQQQQQYLHQQREQSAQQLMHQMTHQTHGQTQHVSREQQSGAPAPSHTGNPHTPSLNQALPSPISQGSVSTLRAEAPEFIPRTHISATSGPTSQQPPPPRGTPNQEQSRIRSANNRHRVPLSASRTPVGSPSGTAGSSYGHSPSGSSPTPHLTRQQQQQQQQPRGVANRLRLPHNSPPPGLTPSANNRLRVPHKASQTALGSPSSTAGSSYDHSSSHSLQAPRIGTRQQPGGAVNRPRFPHNSPPPGLISPLSNVSSPSAAHSPQPSQTTAHGQPTPRGFSTRFGVPRNTSRDRFSGRARAPSAGQQHHTTRRRGNRPPHSGAQGQVPRTDHDGDTPSSNMAAHFASPSARHTGHDGNTPSSIMVAPSASPSARHADHQGDTPSSSAVTPSFVPSVRHTDHDGNTPSSSTAGPFLVPSARHTDHHSVTPSSSTATPSLVPSAPHIDHQGDTPSSNTALVTRSFSPSAAVDSCAASGTPQRLQSHAHAHPHGGGTPQRLQPHAHAHPHGGVVEASTQNPQDEGLVGRFSSMQISSMQLNGSQSEDAQGGRSS